MPSATTPGKEVNPAGVGVGHQGVGLSEVVVLVLGKAESANGRTFGSGVAASGAELQVARREKNLLSLSHTVQMPVIFGGFHHFAFATGHKQG